MRFTLTRFAVAGAAILTAGAALAHHSTAMFSWGKEVKIASATVEPWEWTNPHTFLYVTVGSEHWAFEGMSPNHLSRAGWSRRSLAAGDKIDLTYYALRDGRRGGFNVRVFKEDGTRMSQLPSAE